MPQQVMYIYIYEARKAKEQLPHQYYRVYRKQLAREHFTITTANMHYIKYDSTAPKWRCFKECDMVLQKSTLI